MDIAEFIRKHKDDVIEEQQKHVFWNDLTEALGSIYKLKTEYTKSIFLFQAWSSLNTKHGKNLM
jgi:hypothetical protein